MWLTSVSRLGGTPAVQRMRRSHDTQRNTDTEARRMSPARLDEHEADTFREHVLVNMLSPW